MTDPLDVSVIGAGTMGHGLAVQFARTGHDVTLIDHRDANLERARTRIDDAVSFLDAEGLLTPTPDSLEDSISVSTDPEGGVATADLVLETVSEDLGAKREVFRTAERSAPGDAVLASNTSGIPITDVADGLSAPDRVVGCHWWNPPYLMPLVEVVRGAETSDETAARTEAFVEAADRTPIRVERDVPGFVWNRIQFAVLREAMHIVEAGIASLEDVDAAVRDGYALRTAVVGPFETVDLSGLDLFETIAADLYPALCDDDAPSELFASYGEGGNGVEDGRGFYEYDEPPAATVRRRDERIAALRRALGR